MMSFEMFSAFSASQNSGYLMLVVYTNPLSFHFVAFTLSDQDPKIYCLFYLNF